MGIAYLGMIDSSYQLITGTQPSTWDFLLSSNLIGFCPSEWLSLGMIDSSYQLITGTQPSTWDFLLSSNLIGYFSYQVIWLVIALQNDLA